MANIDNKENQEKSSELELLTEIAYQFNLGDVKSSKKLCGGIVNVSYKLDTSEGKFILQRLSSIWDKRIIEDYRAVQRYLRTNGLHVPVLLNDINERPYYTRDKKIWRAFEFIENDEIITSSPSLAYEAGLALGKFHKLMSESNFNPSFKLEGFHDTPSIINRLKETLAKGEYQQKASYVKEESSLILENIEKYYLPESLPKTLIHGDPKLANFLFKDGKVISVLDLDTMMRASELIDLGDALRSWCKNDVGEYKPEIFSSAMKGYRISNPIPYDNSQVKNAMSLITLELAARFLIDYFEESYFAFDLARFKTLAEQNLDRTRFTLDYYRDFSINS